MGNPELYPEHLLLALLDQELPQQLVPDAAELRARRPKQRSREAVGPGDATAAERLGRVLSRARQGRRRGEADGGRLRLDRAPAARARRRAARSARGEDQGGARRPARHVAGSRGDLPGAREVRPRPDRRCRGGQARPGDRARRGSPPRDPGAVAPHEEQPRPDRRPRRRQDGDRRGAGAAHRRRRRPGRPQGQARLGARHRRAPRRLEVPRRVRGAAEGRARTRSSPPRAGSSSSSTSCTRSSARVPPKAPSARATSSSRCSRAASCAPSAQRRSTSTASTSRRTPRSSAASSRSSSASRRSPTRSRSCAA